ncbi:MAG: hypothetical protein SVU32_01225 [Candidatus Nanohaloarchaea archaeon]|nr:hypothetical protein [Candidatus Nanohaloarchaea archaeon]
MAEDKVIRVTVEHRLAPETEKVIYDVIDEFTEELREITRTFASNF